MTNLFGGDAPAQAVLNLWAQLAMGAALLFGMWLARRRNFRAHAVCQTAVVLLNLIPIAGHMLPVFRRGVLPGLPSRLGDSFYAWPAAHAALGAAAELLGLYIILRAGTNLLPEALRFDNYKLWMRAALALWWLVIALGLGTYFTWHGGGAEGAAAPAVVRQTAAPGASGEANGGRPTPAAVSTPASVTVLMRNFAFEPKELTVAPGTTVVWKDEAGRHSVRADDGGFESEVLPAGGEFRHTFAQPGRYPYYCTLHGAQGGGEMSGVVIVSGGGAP